MGGGGRGGRTAILSLKCSLNEILRNRHAEKILQDYHECGNLTDWLRQSSEKLLMLHIGSFNGSKCDFWIFLYK